MVLFPDIEALLVVWLRDQMTVPVSNKVPNPRPVAFGRVARHGGVRSTVVTDAPQVGLEWWAATDAEAHDLAQQARSLMLYTLSGQILGGHVIYRVDEAGGPVPLPDPASAQPRYVSEFVVHVRGLPA